MVLTHKRQLDILGTQKSMFLSLSFSHSFYHLRIQADNYHLESLNRSLQAISDEFYPLPYLNGQSFTITKALETEVKAELLKLLKLYQARDYSKLVQVYELSWKHIALTYDYGLSARSYADNAGFRDDLLNTEYEFSLDFSNSKLRIEAGGKLVGFYPPPLVGKEPDGFVAIEFPVYFMRTSDGKLKIGG